MHKKLTRIYGSTNYVVNECGCEPPPFGVGRDHDDEGNKVIIAESVGATIPFTTNEIKKVRLTELQEIIKTEK